VLRALFEPALARLGRAVYPAFLPVDGAGRAAARYLPDLLRDAPPVVAVGSAGLALAVYLLPPLVIRRARPFSMLAPADQEEMLRRLFCSRFYLWRSIGYACKGAALIAVLRDPEVRRDLLAEGDDA